MNLNPSRLLLIFLVGCLSLVFSASAQAAEPIPIGSRLEPLVDHGLIDSLKGGASLELHSPQPREIAFKFDQAWEGNASGYCTLFRDGDIYRMYYRGSRYLIDKKPLRMAHTETVCYAESQDGIHWTRPNLGIYKWEGAKDNNIIFMGSPEAHNFSPFKDINPDCLPGQRYKAVGGTTASKGLWTFQSADGIHWERLSKTPVVTKGAFDSHNTVFWDAEHKRYSMYVRFFSEGQFKGLRLIGESHSKDFINWSEPVGLDYPGSPPQQMYTNQIRPYYRAPHILYGFPTRYIAKPLTKHVEQLPPVDLRKQLINLGQRLGTDQGDGVFMSSRDGLSFERWDEAFLRPGPEAEHRWVYGDNYSSYGLFETKSDIPGLPNEISMHFDEGAWRDDIHRVRRYTIRLDGFVSLNAPYAGGSMTTKPLVFSGSKLNLNYATSAAGTLKVEIQNADGSPIPGFSLKNSTELFGDSTNQVISWENGSDVSSLAGKSVRLHFELKDGDLYSFQFGEGE
ncbi:MAG: hypothetical protein JKY95_12895 [Planctomycetaceae bacterium]|nr:hypothetical protein [Planctomycetaceae bacterium]